MLLLLPRLLESYAIGNLDTVCADSLINLIVTYADSTLQSVVYLAHSDEVLSVTQVEFIMDAISLSDEQHLDIDVLQPADCVRFVSLCAQKDDIVDCRLAWTSAYRCTHRTSSACTFLSLSTRARCARTMMTVHHDTDYLLCV